MKKLLLGFASSLFSVLTVAQPYGNEWIDYNPNRQYPKFQVTEDGIYRIDHTALSSALLFLSPSVNISTVDPRTIQIFGRGEELYIHVEGESDGAFDSGDYIEFYAEKNNGWLDERLYPSAAEHTNPHYSLYTDTAVYFITWDPDATVMGNRITTVPLGTPASTPMSYFLYEEIQPFKDLYNKGRDLGDGKSATRYLGGKGWMSNFVGYNVGTNNSGRLKSFSTGQAYTGTGAPQARIEMALTGINLGAGFYHDPSDAHHVRMRYAPGNSNNFTTLKDVVFDSHEYLRETAAFSPALLTDNIARFQAFAEPTGSLVNATSDYSSVAYMKLTYPHTPAFEGNSRLKFRAPANSLAVYLNGTNWSTSTTRYLYDPSVHRRYEVDHQSNGTIKTNIPAGEERYLYLCTDPEIHNVSASGFAPVNGTGKFVNYLDNPPDSAYIIITHSKLAAQAQQYATYRSLNHSVKLVMIEDLYDQFAYGIRLHPLSIRGFCDFAIDQWNTPPQYLLLIGKSVQESDHRDLGATPEERAQCLVPTMGTPPSDVYLTAGLGNDPYAPALATGRIAALTGSQVSTYKNKIQVTETGQSELPGSYSLQTRQWQKHILHFAGGSSKSENNRFQGHLSTYRNLLESAPFGGKVFLFSKTSGNAIEPLNTDSVRLLIEQGASIMTFFGHAASNTFDISVDDPSNWGNTGRYPVVIANSCYSGNIHLNVDIQSSIGEQYVFTPNQGAIAFIATPDVSYENQLDNYSEKLHEELVLFSYSSTIGKQMQTAAAKMTASTPSESEISVALEMTLHGDPALRVYPHAKSELTINDPVLGPSVTLEPSSINTDIDSFDVVVNISNLGRSATAPFSASVTRSFPNGANETFQSQTVSGVDYEREIRLTLPVDPINGIGVNELHVEVDRPVSSVEEFDDFTNNEVANLKVEVISSDIRPVYPYDFAVVPDMNVLLRANTGYPFTASMEYLMQIDTIDTYDSPFMKETTIEQSGAVIAWNPELASFALPDSTVFFWRVTPKSDLSKWKEFSFQVVNGSTGWGQAHFFQMKHNKLDFLSYDRAQRQFSFTEASRLLQVYNIGNPDVTNTLELFAIRYSLDGQSAPLGEYGVAPGGAPSIAIAVIDTLNLMPWGTYGLENGTLVNADHQFGNSNNYNPNSSRGRRVEYWFSFSVSSGLDNMVDMINQVPDGYYILAYSLRNGQFQDTAHWDNEHYQAFEALGADSIRYVGNDHPYIFFAQKGVPSSAAEVLGHSDRAVIDFETKIYSNVKQGLMEGPVIGPGLRWETLYQQSFSLEANADVNVVSGYGIDANSVETPAVTMTSPGSASLFSLDPTVTQTMRLAFETQDNTAGTPGQLSSWHVLYEPAPEAALNPFRGTVWSGDLIPAGANMYFGVAVENISDFDFDSVYVHYWLTNSKGETEQEFWLGYASLVSGRVVLDSVGFSTQGLSGRYTAWMEVNPQNERWHREQYQFNNTAYRSFQVKPDNNNPLLDVTFDGIHILNGDIVSPAPEIVMELKDENQFLLLDDTAAFDVFMTYPSGAQERIPFVAAGKEVMAFTPATTKKNKARVSYRPELLGDGTHQLSVVARDASGNSAGNTAYSIEFEVINRSMVTHVMNYPNPFSTSTRFVFTLTGARVPDVFTVQILTVTGKVVREITKDELGAIHIGRNITDYAWDGRDEYGDRLANGVYVYRVIMKIDGEHIERMQSNADQYFTKEFGKMYLFR